MKRKVKNLAQGIKCPYCDKVIPTSFSFGGDSCWVFLNNPEEDIYTPKDGKRIRKEK